MMKRFGEHLQTDDWTTEKHVPVIECPDTVKAGEMFDIKLSVGKQVSHPNTTEHHIRWIQVYYHPEGEKFSYQLANCEFTAHGESVPGPDKGPAYTHHAATVTTIVKKPGTVYALGFCNIHGLWENAKEIKIG